MSLGPLCVPPRSCPFGGLLRSRPQVRILVGALAAPIRVPLARGRVVVNRGSAGARRVVVAILVVCVAAFVGCGGSDSPSEPAGPPERDDPAARLPSGWQRVVNRRAGFTVGIPPGWTARGARGATLVRSGDRLLAVSISADRSPEGQDLRPTAYVERLVKALPGYRRLRPGRPRPVSVAHYPGAFVFATGTFARTRVAQAIQAVALQRRGQVTYTLLFFRTARAPGALYRPAVAGMLRTFRARAAG
jgi:hypothetical protein